MTLTVAQADDESAWDAYVHAHPAASGYHLWGWRRIFAGVFGHEVIYLTASRGAGIVGALPLVHFRSRIFGRFLVSLPFVNYGGVLADDQDVAEALVAEAGRLGRSLDCSHVELRHRARRFPALAAKHHKVAMLLALPVSSDTLWTALDRKVRNQVRKAEKSGLVAEDSDCSLVPDFYRVFARNMRDLGTPVYPRRLFDAVFDAFPGRARAVVVRLKDRPVAAGITWRWRDCIEVPWASSLREFNGLAPNNLLYWTILQRAIAGGATQLDFGRSTPNEGTFHFKRQWGAEPEPLCWEYDVVGGELPDQSPKNPKFSLAIKAWRRLPVPVANVLGPAIVRSIP